MPPRSNHLKQKNEMSKVKESLQLTPVWNWWFKLETRAKDNCCQNK